MAIQRLAKAVLVAGCCIPLGFPAHREPAAGETPVVARVDVSVHRTLVPLFLRAPDGEPAKGIALAPEDLKVTVAGKRIAASTGDGYSVDVSCGDLDTVLSRPQRITRRVVIVADLNFVDTAARFRIADALDSLADGTPGDPALYSVVAISNRVIPLTPGFVPAGRQLGNAASALRSLTSRPTAPAVRQLRTGRHPSIGPSGPSSLASISMQSSTGPACHATNSCSRRSFERRPRGCPVVVGQEIDHRSESPGKNVAEGIAPEGTLSQREATGFLGGMNKSRGAAIGSQITPMGFHNDQPAPDYVGDVIVGHDIGRSVRAILAIVRAYSALPPPKWLVLFSGEAFRSSRENKNDAAVSALSEAAARRFTVWTVDAAGISRRQSGASELLAAVAMDSGGLVVRGTNDLATVFRRVEQSSSCYALLGLPPLATPGHQTVPFDVAIDTQRRPDLWGYTIAAPRVVRTVAKGSEVDAAVAEVRGTQGALSSVSLGGGFLWPEATADGATLGLHVVVDAPAAPKPEGYLVDLTVAVEYEGGGSVRPLGCGVTGGTVSNRLRVKGLRPLVALYDCDFLGAGRYRATVTAVDPEEGRVGVRAFVLEVPEKAAETVVVVPWAALLARRDDAVVWRPAAPAAGNDSAGGRVFSPSDGEIPAGCASEISFVVCGEERAGWLERASVTFVRWDARQGTGEMAGIVPSTGLVRAQAAGAPACVAVRAAIAPFSLPPGEYAWLAEAAGVNPSDPSMLLSAGVFTIR